MKQAAHQLGFDACGIAGAGVIDPSDHLGAWLDRGFHADMSWMARNSALRQDVRRKLPGAQSVVVLAKNYYARRPEPPKDSGRVSRYAWGRDYHRVMKKPLLRLSKFIERIQGGVRTYHSIDTGPVMERAWAQRAGLAAIGKHSLALRRDMGSWFFLATVITTLELDPDPPATDLCGTCTLCLEACPTQAIVTPYIVDANRCISYQTIENRGTIPEALHEAHGRWVFGCDDCQQVCPWNRFATETPEQAFHPRPGHANPDPDTLVSMSREQFEQGFSGTPLRRAKFEGIRRNAQIVQHNVRRRSKS